MMQECYKISICRKGMGLTAQKRRGKLQPHHRSISNILFFFGARKSREVYLRLLSSAIDENNGKHGDCSCLPVFGEYASKLDKKTDSDKP
jgi:hypothetical protein